MTATLIIDFGTQEQRYRMPLANLPYRLELALAYSALHPLRVWRVATLVDGEVTEYLSR